MTHIMLDIETLGTRVGAIVTSIALVRFSDEAGVQVNLNMQEQADAGLHSSPETLDWWSKQDPSAWHAATVNPLPVRDALSYVRQWIEWASGGEFPLIWCHGATFDAPLVTELYRVFGPADPPWAFWSVRDTRTLYDLAGINVKDFAVPPPHIALNDAIAQTRAANAALRAISDWRFRKDAVTA